MASTKNILLFLCVLFFSCEKDPVKFTLTVTSNPIEGGLVNPTSGIYESGESVTILASANQYYSFKNWSGGWNSQLQNVTITMDSDKAIVGNFEKIDNDEDGIVNLNDLCPNTLKGFQADTNGCSLSQIDTDNDGITDDLDQCPNDGINGNIINSVGCKVDIFYLDSNGMTVKAIEDAQVGMIENFEGIDYVVVDNETLRNLIYTHPAPFLPDNLVTTKVTDMSYLFEDEIIFNNTDILRKWDVSNVENFEGMFKGARPYYSVSPYNKLFIDNWDTSSAKNMSYMFQYTRDIGDFNFESGFKIIGIGSWDVSNVTDMTYMFFSSNFNEPIGEWDVSKVETMEGMFNSSPFNEPIGEWDVSSVFTMRSMFMYGSFNQSIGEWDVSNVSDMHSMFFYGFGMPTNELISPGVYFSRPPFHPFDQDIGGWDVSNVYSMSQMLQGSVINKDLSSWNVSNVSQCTWFAKNTPNWTLPKPNFVLCSTEPD